MGVVGHGLDRLSTLCYGVGAVALGAVTVLMTLRIVSRNLGLELAGLQLYYVPMIVGVTMLAVVYAGRVASQVAAIRDRREG